MTKAEELESILQASLISNKAQARVLEMFRKVQVDAECLKETVKKYQGLLHAREVVEAARVSREERAKRLPFLSIPRLGIYEEGVRQTKEDEPLYAGLAPSKTFDRSKWVNDLKPGALYTPDMDAVRREELAKAKKVLRQQHMQKLFDESIAARKAMGIKQDCNCADQTDCTGECMKEQS